MENSIALLHLGPPNSVEVDVIEYPVEEYPELAASLQQPNDVAGAPTRLTQLPATITCVRVRFQNRELASQIQTLQSLLDEKEEKLQEARWKEESHAEVLQDWMLQMRELEKANGDLQEQAAKASRDLQKQADDAELEPELQKQLDKIKSQYDEVARGFAVTSGHMRSMEEAADPFVISPSGPTHLRHSNFDGHLLALAPGASAAKTKRAIQAHLRDTERRMEEAGKLGTALLQQQKELTEKLREVERLQSETELDPDLRQRLLDIEKDYNEVARDSARALLPKQRVPSNESQGSPYSMEGKAGRRSVSPSKFETLATPSPTKFSVPNRKVGNQPASRIHNIEFAAEISTSLIAQVRNLQALLSEKEEELKEVNTDRSRLELEVEGFQRLVVDNAGLTERRKAMRNPGIGGRITPSLPRKSEVSRVNPGPQSTSNYGSSDWASDEEQSDVQANVQPDVHTAAKVTLPDTLLGRDS